MKPEPKESSSDSDSSNDNTETPGTSKSKLIRAKDFHRREQSKKNKKEEGKKEKKRLENNLEVMDSPLMLVHLSYQYPVRPPVRQLVRQQKQLLMLLLG
jgi:hypothetical protein